MNPDVRDTPSCIRGGFPTTRPLRSRTRARLVPGRAGEPYWSLGRHSVYGERADRAPYRVRPQTDVYVPREGTRSSVFAPRGKCYCPRGRLARPSVLVEICSGRSEQRATSARCRSAFFLASHAHPSLARSVLLDPELIPGNGNPNSDTCSSRPRSPPKPKHRQDGERGGWRNMVRTARTETWTRARTPTLQTRGARGPGPAHVAHELPRLSAPGCGRTELQIARARGANATMAIGPCTELRGERHECARRGER